MVETAWDEVGHTTSRGAAAAAALERLQGRPDNPASACLHRRVWSSSSLAALKVRQRLHQQ